MYVVHFSVRPSLFGFSLISLVLDTRFFEIDRKGSGLHYALNSTRERYGSIRLVATKHSNLISCLTTQIEKTAVQNNNTMKPTQLLRSALPTYSRSYKFNLYEPFDTATLSSSITVFKKILGPIRYLHEDTSSLLLFVPLVATLSSGNVSREIRQDTPSTSLGLPSYVVAIVRHLCYMLRTDGTEFFSFSESTATLTSSRTSFAKLAVQLASPEFSDNLISIGFSKEETCAMVRRAIVCAKRLSESETYESLISSIISYLFELNKFRTVSGTDVKVSSLSSIAKDFSAEASAHRTLGARAFRRWKGKVVMPRDS